MIKRYHIRQAESMFASHEKNADKQFIRFYKEKTEIEATIDKYIISPKDDILEDAIIKIAKIKKMYSRAKIQKCLYRIIDERTSYFLGKDKKFIQEIISSYNSLEQFNNILIKLRTWYDLNPDKSLSYSYEENDFKIVSDFEIVSRKDCDTFGSVVVREVIFPPINNEIPNKDVKDVIMVWLEKNHLPLLERSVIEEFLNAMPYTRNNSKEEIPISGGIYMGFGILGLKYHLKDMHNLGIDLGKKLDELYYGQHIYSLRPFPKKILNNNITFIVISILAFISLFMIGNLYNISVGNVFSSQLWVYCISLSVGSNARRDANGNILISENRKGIKLSTFFLLVGIIVCMIPAIYYLFTNELYGADYAKGYICMIISHFFMWVNISLNEIRLHDCNII